MATLRAPTPSGVSAAALQRIREAVLRAVGFDDARDLRKDPSYGLNQLKVIAWTTASTAKSNPAPAQAVLQSLRDILARWSQEGGVIPGDPAALVVVGDAAPEEAMSGLEQIILVSSDSMQAQTLADALRTVAILLETAPSAWRSRLADIARRSLSSLGDHVLTGDLQSALAEVAAALGACGFRDGGAGIRAAADTLARSNGLLNSRSTRVPMS